MGSETETEGDRKPEERRPRKAELMKNAEVNVSSSRRSTMA